MNELASRADRAAELAGRDARIDQFELRAGTSWSLRFVRRGGELRRASTSTSIGLALRAYHGRGHAYVAVDQVDDGAVRALVERAGRLAEANARRQWSAFEPHVTLDRVVGSVPDVAIDPHDAGADEIEALLARVEAGALEAAEGVVSQAAFGSRRETTLLMTSAGGRAETTTLLSTLMAQANVRGPDRVGEGVEWRGGERGLSDYEDEGGPEALGREAGRQAVESVDAVTVPAGRHRTLCDNNLTGLLCHEAFGHLTEYDLVAPGWSVLQGRLGERLAPDTVTVRDVPVMEHDPRQGVRVPVDHEGTEGRPVTLLEQGVLTEFMHHRDSAPDAGAEPTGNARSLSVKYAPIVRMRNTVVEPGELTREEAFELLGDGLYLIGARGGAPRPDGSFLFTAQRGYVVENGEPTRPVRMATIHGNVFDFLSNVEGLTREQVVHTNFFGGCGKWNQSYLHVGTGGPHVLVSEALVGGQG